MPSRYWPPAVGWWRSAPTARDSEELGEVCTQWIDLPSGSFREQGTSVNTAIVVLDN